MKVNAGICALATDGDLERGLSKSIMCQDPRGGGELCMRRAKSGETLVEARSDSDVQIVHCTWVSKRRKTNRTILVAGSLRSFPQDS